MAELLAYSLAAFAYLYILAAFAWLYSLAND